METDLEKFERTMRGWLKDNPGHKSRHEYDTPSSRELIAMGEVVVPWLLDYARVGNSWLAFYAIDQIAGGPTIEEEMRGRLEIILDAFLSWGEEKGYGFWPQHRHEQALRNEAAEKAAIVY